MNDIQQQVQKAIDELVESGEERGLQAAVYRHGELVVDAVAGVADPDTGRPFAPDTPVFSYSIGKGVAATVVHVLADKGVLDYDTRIAELWPEFGAHGKEKATVRHALSQSVGVPGLPDGLTVEDLTDWEKMCAIIADSEPWWEPGTKVGYHAITWGYIVGEIVRRATVRRWPNRWASPTNSSSPSPPPSRAGWRGSRTPRPTRRCSASCPRTRRSLGWGRT